MIATISSALSALKTSVDFAKTAIAVRDDVKIAEATQLVNERIIDVQNSALQMQEKMSALRDEIESLKAEKRDLAVKLTEQEQSRAERNKYKLHELTTGSFVLAYAETGDDAAPMHYLCQPCMDNLGKKSVLQRRYHTGSITLRCPTCENQVGTAEKYNYSRPRLSGY